MSKKDIPVAKAKGRPMLTWVGDKPLARVSAISAPGVGAMLAVKVIDMLGEEFAVTAAI